MRIIEGFGKINEEQYQMLLARFEPEQFAPETYGQLIGKPCICDARCSKGGYQKCKKECLDALDLQGLARNNVWLEFNGIRCFDDEGKEEIRAICDWLKGLPRHRRGNNNVSALGC